MISSFPDGADSASRGCCVPALLAATPHHHHVGRVRALSPEQHLLHLPHHLSLLGLRELLHQPHPLRFPLREFPQGLPASLHLQALPEAFCWETGQSAHGELLYHTLHHKPVSWVTETRFRRKRGLCLGTTCMQVHSRQQWSLQVWTLPGYWGGRRHISLLLWWMICGRACPRVPC